MTISRSTVKAVCSQSEAALVRASRKGEIEQLSQAQLQQHAARARKLAAKWQGLGRGQARARGRQTGFGEADANTRLKAEIFREALDSFAARLATLDHAAPAAKARPRTKRDRSAEHRARRAAIRKGMTAAEDLLNSAARKPPAKPVKAARKVQPQPVAEPSPAAKVVVKPRAAGKAKPPKKPGNPATAKLVAQQREATAAAKQSRIARSGKLARMRGHISARGKRSQGRRDARN